MRPLNFPIQCCWHSFGVKDLGSWSWPFFPNFMQNSELGNIIPFMNLRRVPSNLCLTGRCLLMSKISKGRPFFSTKFDWKEQNEVLRIHGTGIFTSIWWIFMVNVGKYTIHGSYGKEGAWGFSLGSPNTLRQGCLSTLWYWGSEFGSPGMMYVYFPFLNEELNNEPQFILQNHDG